MVEQGQLLGVCESRVGTVLRGKWTLERLVGVGGMAAVYEGRHKIGRRDAIKILHKHVAQSKDIAARFEQEAHAVNKFGHPGAVEIRDIDVSEDGCPFLVMELLEGEDLGKRTQRLGGVVSEELLRFIDELLDVLAAAHAQGIVHRDIKLDNLFVTKEGPLKVLDFGIARMRTGKAVTIAGARLGTAAYMAPEQVRGEQVDGRADLFAVGATMFRLVTKRKVHDIAQESDLMMAMGRDPAPKVASIAPHTDPNLALVIDRALEFKPTDRYPSAATMQADLRALRANQPPPFATARLSDRQAPVVTKPATPEAKTAATAIPVPPSVAPAAPAAPVLLAAGSPTIVDPNTTLPCEGVTNVIAEEPLEIAVESAPGAVKAEPRAQGIGTMPSAQIRALVEAARPAGQATPPGGSPSLNTTAGQPVGKVRLGGAAAAGPPAGGVKPKATEVMSAEAALQGPLAAAALPPGPSALHATAPSAGVTPKPPTIEPTIGNPARVPPPPPISKGKRKSAMVTLIVVGVVCLLIGSIGFYLFIHYSDSDSEDSNKKKNAKSAAALTQSASPNANANTPLPTPVQPGAPPADAPAPRKPNRPATQPGQPPTGTSTAPTLPSVELPRAPTSLPTTRPTGLPTSERPWKPPIPILN